MEYAGDPQNPDKKSFVLCFDGTGNKFENKDTDSNILKIYRLLDRTQPNQFSWYNPGIGTYVRRSSIEHSGTIAKIRSWYNKTKAEAFGSDLAEHVMAGYQFLMRYYSCDDDIYIFGFSRGAYTARFLAEMLDHVGLLSAGNEELQRFAWKTFSQWQARPANESEQDQAKRLEIYNFMKGFRETFSRPVRRIRFLGLFDTVNSVPRFESAMMQRAKHPYTARSSAKVIRHAVSIGERRAKFRVDLVSGKHPDHPEDEGKHFHRYASDLPTLMSKENVNGEPKTSRPTSPLRDNSPTPAPSLVPGESQPTQPTSQPARAQDSSTLSPPRPGIPRLSSYTQPYVTHSTEDLHHASTHPHARRHLRRRFSDLRRSQDILEVWFSGNHGDIGGGWSTHPTEKWPLAHAPLVWMVKEAQKAGLKFDPEKLAALYCSGEKFNELGERDAKHEQKFHDALAHSYLGFEHDCLKYNKGLKAFRVLSWSIMEHMPFRRMDLQGDGSWKPIRWPLPKGEVRDVPGDAKIHISVLKRMEAKGLEFRPGNVICLGKGGRGSRVAPKELGMGQWVCWDEVGGNGGNGEIFVNKGWADSQGHKGRAWGAPRERQVQEQEMELEVKEC